MPKANKRCEICDRVPASDEEWDTIPEGEGDHLCWEGPQCSNNAVDWRTRARKAEVERDKAHRKIEKQRVTLKNLENKYLSIKTTLKLGIKDHLDNSYTVPPQWNRDEVIVGLREEIEGLQKQTEGDVRKALTEALEFCYHCGGGLIDEFEAPYCEFDKDCGRGDDEPPPLIDRLVAALVPKEPAAGVVDTTKAHMLVIVDVDWATMRCPCGQEICSRFESDAAWGRFKSEHAEHTSGYIKESATAKALAWGNTDPNLRPLFPNKGTNQ
jgi:hypothetical protein